MKAVIHATGIAWQKRYLEFFKKGFAKHGIQSELTSSDRIVPGDIHVLFGPNYWKNCERGYDNFLQVNRKFLGNVNDNVTIGWNGFNGRGQFCVDDVPESIDADVQSMVTLLPWKRTTDPRALIMGQADLGRCTFWRMLPDWYHDMQRMFNQNFIFRKWPGDRNLRADVARAGISVTLNSTVAIETLILGHPTAAFDEGSPVWAVCAPGCNVKLEPPREKLLSYLAMCQYHFTDIECGLFWDQLNPRRGPRLCDVRF